MANKTNRRNKKERAAGVQVFTDRVDDVLDLVFTLANREDADPLVIDARLLVDRVERAQGLEV